MKERPNAHTLVFPHPNRLHLLKPVPSLYKQMYGQVKRSPPHNAKIHFNALLVGKGLSGDLLLQRWILAQDLFEPCWAPLWKRCLQAQRLAQNRHESVNPTVGLLLAEPEEKALDFLLPKAFGYTRR